MSPPVMRLTRPLLAAARVTLPVMVLLPPRVAVVSFTLLATETGLVRALFSNRVPPATVVEVSVLLVPLSVSLAAPPFTRLPPPVAVMAPEKVEFAALLMVSVPPFRASVPVPLRPPMEEVVELFTSSVPAEPMLTGEFGRLELPP